ncbi:hypothetical protein LS482_19740 [Sinomicrobium kalidii]|uniref:hypothetical protein n=1 Tax=Sinomicrobium kalidii TaxID=2900738 RepID=UPI001E61B25C|nr:hypothetical protein [Sinomicrobium kalidii]UGU15899.1 hypothetical protein LS482_19740 [Sinomicrobium kalidii]
MKNYISLFLFLISLQMLAQGTVGINELDPKTTMDINATDPTNPDFDEGIIVPRVTNLNVTDPKEAGLLVFYESPDNDRGFYWWDGATWWPFISVSQVTADLTIAHAFCKNTFREGDMTANTATNLRTIEFDGFKTNDVGNYEVNLDGELVVKRGGKYHVYGVVNVRHVSASTGAGRRDALEAKLYVNGTDASATNGNLNIEGANSFPTGNFTIVMFMSGVLHLDDNDRLLFKVNRYYRDADSPITIRPDPDALSNLTLKYLGDF